MRQRPWIAALGIIVVMVLAGVACFWTSYRDDSMHWRTDIAAARTEAATSGKPVLLKIGAPWCAACERMSETTLREPTVTRLLNQYVPVAVDFDDNPQLMRQLQAETIPCFFVVEAKTGRVTKENRIGWMTIDDFAAWLTDGKEGGAVAQSGAAAGK